jgi:hypothetical protein
MGRIATAFFDLFSYRYPAPNSRQRSLFQGIQILEDIKSGIFVISLKPWPLGAGSQSCVMIFGGRYGCSFSGVMRNRKETYDPSINI